MIHSNETRIKTVVCLLVLLTLLQIFIVNISLSLVSSEITSAWNEVFAKVQCWPYLGHLSGTLVINLLNDIRTSKLLKVALTSQLTLVRTFWYARDYPEIQEVPITDHTVDLQIHTDKRKSNTQKNTMLTCQSLTAQRMSN